MAMIVGAASSAFSVGKREPYPFSFFNPSESWLHLHTGGVRWRRNVKARCFNSPGRDPGENGSKAVLDAFFLGKAFAEAINERIGTAVGEFLSDVGRWQAEQQKQIRDFQEEVLERARIAEEKAAREALENEQKKLPASSSYITSNSSSTVSSPASDNYATSVDSRSVLNNRGSLQRESNGK